MSGDPIDEGLGVLDRGVNRRGQLKVAEPFKRTDVDWCPVRLRLNDGRPRMLCARIEHGDAGVASCRQFAIGQ